MSRTHSDRKMSSEDDVQAQDIIDYIRLGYNKRVNDTGGSAVTKDKVIPTARSATMVAMQPTLRHKL